MAIKRKNGASMAATGARVGLGVAAVIAATTRPAIAQQNPERRLTVIVAGGPVLSSRGAGFHASAAIDLRTPASPLRLRAEGLYANWRGIGVTRFSSIVGSAVVSPFPHARVSPYAIAGVGGYANFGDGMRAGWSFGLGVRSAAAAHLLLESRVHAFTWTGSDRPLGNPPAYPAYGKWKYVWLPVSLGIRF